jgi:hypothetical protein
MSRPESPVRERFEALAGPPDGDWQDVTRRVKRRTRRVAALVAVALVALVASGFGIGGTVIGLFDVHGKHIPLSSLSDRDRELLVTSMCPHPELRATPGRAPRPTCREGEPSVEEIADDGSQAHYRIRYPWGLTCVASGPVGGRHDPTFGDSIIATLGCNAGAPGHKLVPTPKRPITVDASLGSSAKNPRLRLLRLSGLAGRGVTSVGLVAKGGPPLKTPVRGNAYSFGSIPDRPWVAVAAYDRGGTEVYREPLPGVGRTVPALTSPPAKSSVWSPGPPKRPDESPLQHASTTDAVADVYRNGVVLLRFKSASSEAYRRLIRTSNKSSDTAGIGCLKVAFGGGRWETIGGGANAHVGRTMGARIANYGGALGGMPSPPFDVCQISGTYGRYWNDEEGTHELVEVPFTPIARRYLDERATARDLAYLVRSKKMHAIRLAIHRGGPAPSANELARIFGSRIVPLASREGTAPNGNVGVWSDGKLIVATEQTPAGRRLHVTIDALRIGPNSIRDLSFVY